MAIYDKASLVLIPSGTKTSKVYSQKPTNGDGDFTFSRSTAATRVNASGNIEKERTNHITYSEDFTQWGLIGTATRTTGLTDPNGGSTAVKVSNIGVGTGNYVDGIRLTSMPVTISAGSVVCQSIYMKGSGTILIGIERAISGSYFFNTQGFTLTSEWQRFDFFNLITTAAGGINFYVTNTTSTTATSVDIAFAQFEFGTAPTAYIPTNGSAVTTGITDNVPRLDYTDSSCPALLLEPQRTNILPQSEFYGSGSGWSGISGVSITDNAIASPEGNQNASYITFTNSGSSTQFYRVVQTTGSKQVLSVFVKYISGSGTGFRLSKSSDINYGINLEFSNNGATLTGTAGTNVDSYKIEDYGNQWFRVSVVINWSSSALEYNLFRHSGTGTDVYAIWGLQVEGSASYATSYIPTYGSAVTRNQDFCRKTNIGSILNDSQGTLFLEMQGISDGGNSRRFTISDGSTNNRVSIEYDETAGSIKSFYSGQGTLNGTIIATGLTQTNNHKVALVYDSSVFKMFIDGVLEGSDTTITSLPVGLDVIEFQSGTTALPMEGLVKQALYIPTALTDQEAIDLTTL